MGMASLLTKMTVKSHIVRRIINISTIAWIFECYPVARRFMLWVNSVKKVAELAPSLSAHPPNQVISNNKYNTYTYITKIIFGPRSPTDYLLVHFGIELDTISDGLAMWLTVDTSLQTRLLVWLLFCEVSHPRERTRWEELNCFVRVQQIVLGMIQFSQA